MKRIIVFSLFLVFTATMMAQSTYQVSINYPQDKLNVLKVSYLDPDQPYSQPILFRLKITPPEGVTLESAAYTLKIEFLWNNGSLTTTTLTPIEVGPNTYGSNFSFTNRDLITSTSNRFFEADSGFSFDDIIFKN
jgi:hypothetical protein